jgi:hypothetical protein
MTGIRIGLHYFVSFIPVHLPHQNRPSGCSLGQRINMVGRWTGGIYKSRNKMSAGIAGCIIALRLKSIVFDSFVFVNITNTGSLAAVWYMTFKFLISFTGRHISSSAVLICIVLIKENEASFGGSASPTTAAAPL